MRNTTGPYMIIAIVLGCLTHLFSFSLGYSTIIPPREEQLNITSSSVQLTSAQVQLPVVIMTVPAVVGACNNLMIDLSASYGHFGRPWTKVSWTVTSHNSTDTNRSSSSHRLADRVFDYLTTYFDPTTARISLPLHLWRESTDVVLSLTASMTNYLQQSSSDTRVVMIHSGRDSSGSSDNDLLLATRYRSNGVSEMALTSILGPRVITMKARAGLQLDGVAQLPSTACPHGNNNYNSNGFNSSTTNDSSSVLSLLYSWFVDRVVNGSIRVSANDVIEQNRDPRRLLIAPYSLQPGERYVVTMMVQMMTNDDFIEVSAVNCSAEVAVATGGRVVALLRGGNRRQVVVGSELSIDAGPSYDEDYSHLDDGGMLGFQWSCEMTALVGNVDVKTVSWFKCPFALNTSTSRSLVVVPAGTLSAGSTYMFHVTVISADGNRRSDSAASVQVTAVAGAVPSFSSTGEQTLPWTASCLIKANSDARMNADQQLLLYGDVLFDGGSHQGVKAMWSVVSASGSWSLEGTARTPLEITIMPSQSTSTRQSFPLALSPSVFAKAVSGETFTFRLTATSTSSSPSSSTSVFSEVVLIVNTPPIGGIVMVYPPSRVGFALSTLFTLVSVGWTDDVDDMPLRYSFQYQLSPSLPLLDIAGPSTTATTSSMLPAGINTNGVNLAVVVVGQVVDAFEAAANASVEVMVFEATGSPTNKNAFLAGGVQAGLAASDADQTLRTVNLAASMLYHHSASVNSNMTAAPSTCSGHGACSFVDVAGNPTTILPETSTKTLTCSVCVCSGGYGGADCSFAPVELVMRNTARKDMCSALMEMAASQDRSTSLFDTLLRSLSIVFDPYEVQLDDGRKTCSYVLRFLANVLREGLVPPPSATSDLLFAQVVSSFLEVYRLPQGSVGKDEGAAAVFESNVRAALGALTANLRSRMVAGQSPLTVAAANLRAIVSYGLSPTMQHSDDITNTNDSNGMVEMHAVATSPHSTGTYPSFAQTSTKVVFDPKQLGSVCGISAADALTTVLQVRADMRKKTNHSLSAIKDKKVSPSYQLSITNAAATDIRSGSMPQGQGPAYYITMPFAAPQDFFNRTAWRRNNVDSLTSLVNLNVTSMQALVLPRCATFDGEKYASCRQCNISSLTSVNVTFACYDIAALCKAISPAVNRGRATSAEGDDYVEPYLSSALLDASIDPHSRALAKGGGKKGGGGGGKKGGAGRAASKHRSAANNKGKNDDLTNSSAVAVDDGNYPPNDDLVTNNAHLDMTEFTVLVPTVLQNVHQTFSINPIAAFSRSSTAGMVLVICFGSGVICGILFFMRWDKADRHEAIYLGEYKEKILEHVVRESLRKGGHGLVREFVTVRGLKLPRKAGPVQRVQRKMRGLLLGGAGNGGIVTEMNPLLVQQQQQTGLEEEKSPLVVGYNNNDDDISLPTTVVPAVTPLAMSVVVERFVDSVLPGKELFETGGGVGYGNNNDTDSDYPRYAMADASPLDCLDLGSKNQDKDDWLNIVKLMLRNHFLVSMFYYPGINGANTRTVRWILVCHALLISLFFDTLFFAVFFSATEDAQCKGLSTGSQKCHSVPSPIVKGQPMCEWSPDTRACYMKAPPASLLFTLMVTLMVLVVIVPAEALLGLVLEGYASKRPRLEALGLGMNSNSWLGAVSVPGKGVNRSPLALMIERLTMHRTQQQEEQQQQQQQGDQSLLDRAEQGRGLGQGSRRKGKDRSKRKDRGSLLQGVGSGVATSPTAVTDQIALSVYGDHCAPAVEAQQLLVKVREYLVSNLPSLDRLDVDAHAEQRYATAAAIQTRLKVAPDGEPFPLSCWQRLRYRNRAHLLECKIAQRRAEAQNARVRVNRLLKRDQAVRDACLLKVFILEQVGFWTKRSVEQLLFSFRDVSNETVHPALWLLASTFYLGLHLYLLYWIFAWGSIQQNAQVKIWGRIYAVCLIQDIIIVEFTKIFIYTVAAQSSVRPQLRVIRQVINDIAMTLLQEGEDPRGEVSVVQHLSPACRAARLSDISDLPAAAILRRVNDHHVQRCRVERNRFRGVLVFICVAVPAIVGRVGGFFLMDQIISIVLAILATWLIISLTTLLDYNRNYLLALCLCLPFVLWFTLIAVPRARRQSRHPFFGKGLVKRQSIPPLACYSGRAVRRPNARRTATSFGRAVVGALTGQPATGSRATGVGYAPPAVAALPLVAAKVHVDDSNENAAGGEGCGGWWGDCCGSLVVLMRLVYWECVYQRNLLWRWHVALARLLPNEALRRARLASARQRQLWTDMNNQGPVVLQADKRNPTTTSSTIPTNNNNKSAAVDSMFQVAAGVPREIRAMLVPAALAQGRSLLTHALMPRPPRTSPTMEEPIDAAANGVNDDGEQGQMVRSNANSNEEGKDGVFPVLTSNLGSSGGIGGTFAFSRRYRIVVEFTSSAQEALRRMVHRHLLGAAAYDARHQILTPTPLPAQPETAERSDYPRGRDDRDYDFDYDYDNIDHVVLSDIRVSFNEIVHLLGWVYHVYYPGKKRLSNEERKEVVEKLIEWWMTEAFSDRQPPPVPEPGPGPVELLNSLLLRPVIDGLLQQQHAFSRGIDMVQSRMTSNYVVDPIPPQTNGNNSNNSDSNTSSWGRAKRRASGTLATAAAVAAAGLSPRRRRNPIDSNTTDLDADAAAELKQRGFTGTRALASSAMSSPQTQPQPVVVLSEKARILGTGAAGKEELIVPASASSAASPFRKEKTTGPAGDVAREPIMSRPTTMVAQGFDQSDNRSQLGSGYTVGRQPPRQQQQGLANKLKTVSFDEFGQWFLALNRDITHRHQVQVQLVRRPRSKTTGRRGVDYDHVSTNRLTSSGGWDIVKDDSSSNDGSDVDDDGAGVTGNIYSFLFGPSPLLASSTAATAPERRGRGGYPRPAGDRNSGLGLDITGGTGMDMSAYLPVDLTYLSGLTGWSQQQQQRNNNADGWDDDEGSNASSSYAGWESKSDSDTSSHAGWRDR